jgi:hypothetical protein
LIAPTKSNNHKGHKGSTKVLLQILRVLSCPLW